MKTLICCAALSLVALWPAGLLAAEFKPAITVLQKHVHVNVDAKGLETVNEILVVRIERKDAVSENANRRISFSPSMHRLDIVEAYTVDPQGHRHEVPQEAIRIQENAINTSGSEFSDYQYKVVVFPKADVGSVLHLHHRKSTFRPLLPGQVFFPGSDESSSGL